ncbi:MAG: hypothetical protein GX495_02060 [Chloroflexi bacterium]|nr:hypothetical protein [Chloroflexota bacterium]
MILLNFGHPLRPDIVEEIERCTGKTVETLLDIPVQFDQEQPFDAQVAALADRAGLSSHDWQTRGILVNPPAHPLVALGLLAELHGRMGYFPAVVRLRPQAGSLPPTFVFAEILNLQSIREAARTRR